MTAEPLKELEGRLKKLEKHSFEDTLTLVEILSTINFFGGLKMRECKYAKDGQCGLFFLQRNPNETIPIATDCRIRGCKGGSGHHHLKLSQVTCTFCPERLLNGQDK